LTLLSDILILDNKIDRSVYFIILLYFYFNKQSELHPSPKDCIKLRKLKSSMK